MAGPNTKKFRLPVNTGVRTDTFAEAVPLMDINNFVLTPDGSALRPREGYEIRRNDGIGYNSGRKNIYYVSNPPDINYGDLIVVVNTSNNRRFNECTEVVRTVQTASTIDPDGNLQPMPDNPSDENEWRAVGFRAAWSNTDSTNRAAAEMLHPTTYETKAVYVDPSEIITTYRSNPSFEIDSTWYMTYSTPSKIILVSIVDQEATIRPRVIVYDLATLGALSNTAASPASADWVWDLEATVDANCNITNFWYDRDGNIAALVEVSGAYRLYRGTTAAAPTDYVTVDTSILDALGSWTIDYDFGFHAADTAEPCFILEGGRMVFQIDDHNGLISERYHLVTIQWDGTLELQDTSFPPSQANIQFNCIWNTRSSTNVIWTGGHANVNHITALGQAPTACTAADDTITAFWYNQGFGPMTSDGTKMLDWDNDTLTYRVISVSGSTLATLHNVIPSPDQEPCYFVDDDRIMVVNGAYKFYNTSDGAEIESVPFLDNPLQIQAWQFVQDPFAHKCYYCNYSMVGA